MIREFHMGALHIQIQFFSSTKMVPPQKQANGMEELPGTVSEDGEGDCVFLMYHLVTPICWASRGYCGPIHWCSVVDINWCRPLKNAIHPWPIQLSHPRPFPPCHNFLMARLRDKFLILINP